MYTIKNLFEQAQLAEAAYANFLDDAGNLTNDSGHVIAALQDASNNMSFSSTQATEFAKHWRVISHQPDTASGFSATLFQ